VVTGALGATLLAVGTQAPPAASAACANPSTRILAGTAQGEDYRFTRTQVSIDLFTADGTRIGWDGCPLVGGYARVVNINTHLGGTGSNDPAGATKQWSLTGIPDNAVRANVEAYPKSANGTDLTRYGRSFIHNRPVGDTQIHLKLPLNCGYADNSVFGRNGSIVGNVSHNGRLVPVHRVSAWSYADPAVVPTMGFGVINNSVTGRFDVDYLAPNQPYVLFVRLAPGMPLRQIWNVWVSSCSTTEVDIVFGKFQDVPARHAFFDEIGWMLEVGLTNGYAGDVFRPGAIVTRQALAAWLYRLAGSPGGYVGPTGFADIAHSPFKREIQWTVAAGQATGYSDGTFRPDRCTTRQALVAMLHRHAGAPPAPSTPPSTVGAPHPTDVPTSHPFHDEITWARAAGVAGGYPDGTFRPGECVTRQAASALLHRYATRV
jgi:hypothetical protein